MLYKLPEELVRIIYSYDRTYLEKYDEVMIELCEFLRMNYNEILCIVCDSVYFDNILCYHCGRLVCSLCVTVCPPCNCDVCINCVYDDED